MFDPDGESSLACWMGPLQASIMSILWSDRSDREWAVQDIYDRLRECCDHWDGAYTTCSTTVHRLVRRGVIKRTGNKRGAKILYSASITKDDFINQHVYEIVYRLMDDLENVFLDTMIDIFVKRYPRSIHSIRSAIYSATMPEE